MEADPALSLGGLRYGVSPLEMARSYTAIARGGEYIEATGIARIERASLVTDANGTVLSPEVLYEAPEVPKAKRVVDESIAKETAAILGEVATRGTARGAQLDGAQAYVKTGTTQNHRDAWIVGWAQGVTTAVWMGHPEAAIDMPPINGRAVVGGTFPADVWKRFYTRAMNERPGLGMPFAPAPIESPDNYDPFAPVEVPSLGDIGMAPPTTSAP
jgi:penicillin-binding protein 1A